MDQQTPHEFTWVDLKIDQCRDCGGKACIAYSKKAYFITSLIYLQRSNCCIYQLSSNAMCLKILRVIIFEF